MTSHRLRLKPSLMQHEGGVGEGGGGAKIAGVTTRPSACLSPVQTPPPNPKGFKRIVKLAYRFYTPSIRRWQNCLVHVQGRGFRYGVRARGMILM